MSHGNHPSTVVVIVVEEDIIYFNSILPRGLPQAVNTGIVGSRSLARAENVRCSSHPLNPYKHLVHGVKATGERESHNHVEYLPYRSRMGFDELV